ncbi:undecaprenyl-diphosphate phosphatase [Clostridium hydrogeniformans]|uniref:undecaprenyl-diphosphate phosphatase n=1 Tax=Clostridium hydrogeniformans TaxID=349933 RepID=UPI0004846D02|nr:undecaprenyl-diphosphate phosphatase [Clostridium hydrogeniformans]
MLLVFKAIIIAIVEGITEFIPVSSTGHMIIVDDIIGFKSTATPHFAAMFQVVIQLGAILAIVVLYWNKIWTSVISFFKLEKEGLKFWSTILVGCIPAAVLGLLLDNWIEANLFNSLTVAAGLIIGAILLIFVENKYRKNSKTKSIDDVTYGQALTIGAFQCLALWPGMSRSSSTIMGGWISGLNNTAAAEFSFFLALPVMVGASGLKLYKYDYSSITGDQIIALIVGSLVAFLVALVVVDRFIAFLKKKPMRIFAVYRILVGVILLILIALKVISIYG